MQDAWLPHIAAVAQHCRVGKVIDLRMLAVVVNVARTVL